MTSLVYIGKELANALPAIIFSARTQISLAMYQLAPKTNTQHAALKDIWNELTRAPARGIKCRAILCKGSNMLPGAIAATMAKEQLTACGWDVELAPESKLMHAKCMTIDDQMLLAGSHNWTDAGMLRNTEVSVITWDELATGITQQWFDRTWKELAK